MNFFYVYLKYIFIVFLLVSCSEQKNVVERFPYPEEINSKINRGLICFESVNSNFLSWRKLPGDSIEYKIWRKEILNSASDIKHIGITNTTFFNDTKLKKDSKYFYCISNSIQPDTSEFQEISKNSIIYRGYNALSFNLEQSYKKARIVTGDLTGDGELEIIVSYSNMKDVDPYEKAWLKSTDKVFVSAFLRNGDLLWTIDLGWGIEAGTFYAPVVVWDIDADGKSEVLLKTNKSDDPRNYDTEYLTILDGETGKISNETRWPSPATRRNSPQAYNSNSRNFIAIAHLDGKKPTIIVARGTYLAQVINAFDSSLNKLWERKIGKDLEPKFNNKYLMKIWRKFSNDKSRSSHSLPIVDIDENGSEEIMWGEHCITLGGEDLWVVKDKIPYYGHLDIVYSADIIPEKPGKETYYCREGWKGEEDNIGMLLVDKNGKTIWSQWGYTHVDGGWASKVIPGNNGWQFFGYDIQAKEWKHGERKFVTPAQHFLNSKGEIISNPDSSWVRSFTVDWEGDNVKELCTEGGMLKRYNNEEIANFGVGVSWGADLFGDHREELVVAPKDGKIYIVLNTSKLESESKITKLADRQYKNDLSRTAMQYNVIPTESGYIPLIQVEN